METRTANVAEKVKLLLNAEVEISTCQTLIKKTREVKICKEQRCFTFIIQHDISFGKVNTDGKALNQAEIFLLPEEYLSFLFALKDYPIPFPTDYRQWQHVNPHIISVCMESIETPENFAARLSAALDTFERKDSELESRGK